MSDTQDKIPEKFGTVLGFAPGEVPAYSSDYASVDAELLPTRSAFRSYLDGVYLGFKWQCVEFARRWLYVNCGYIFDDVAMAYDIFELRSVRTVSDRKELPLHAFANGSPRRPEYGCMIIWAEGGEFEQTGHVAIAIEVTDDYVRIAEQNVGHQRWPAGCNWSRQIDARVTEDEEYWLECSFGDAKILGWVIQTEDKTFGEELDRVPVELLNLRARELPARAYPTRSWLNIANDDESAYVSMMGGHKLTSVDADARKFYVMSESAHEELIQASKQLHSMFMQATDHVLKHDHLLRRFAFPDSMLPKIRKSWDNRLNQLITGRFDFSISDKGIKVYEYNCDSAACYMEVGKVQGRWADHYECEAGDDPGETLFHRLVDTWKDSDVDGLLHIMQDDDPEETYHALFFKDVLEAAGKRCKIVLGLDGMHWNEAGDIVDEDGELVRWVWKTWAWETALDQLRRETDNDSSAPAGANPGLQSRQLRLVDVLLNDKVMVYEPLWTLIPSNKAILPVLWSMYPGHPLLLNTDFELTESLASGPYAQKPVVGRCGANVKLFSELDQLLEGTAGKFEDRDQIYQEYFPLPRVGDYFVQVSTFVAGRSWAGTGVRVDRSRIVTGRSDCMALRVVPDSELYD